MTTPPNRDANAGGLWGHADFLRLWSAQAISAFGSRITRTALPIIAVATLHQSAVMLGVLGAMQLIPGVVLAMLVGGFVDRSNKRRILVAADLIRAGLVASLTVAWALGALSSMVHVIVVGAGVGAASALFQITDVAYLPALIGRRRLAEGNAKLETTEAIAEITGPASAGGLIAALGAPVAVAIDAASYLWSAFMLGRIRTVEPRPRARPATPRPDADEPVELTVRTTEDFRLGIRAVFGHPLVRPIVQCLMVWSIAGGFFMALYTLFCLDELGLSKSAFGVIIAMGGVGSLAGAMLARSLSRALGVGRTLLVTSVASLAFGLFIPLAASGTSRTMTLGFLVAHQLLGDGFAVAFVILAVTLRQTVLPRELLGRANAAIHVCTTGVLPVASLAAGGLAAMIGLRNAVWVGVLIGLAAPAFLWRLRHLKDMPSAELGASDSGMPRASARDSLTGEPPAS